MPRTPGQFEAREGEAGLAPMITIGKRERCTSAGTNFFLVAGCRLSVHGA